MLGSKKMDPTMDSVNILEFGLKFVGICASIAAIYKLINELIYNKRSKLREEYEFLKQYIRDINEKEQSKLVIEKGYLAISGKLLTSDEILYLLKFVFPSLAFSSIHYALKHLEFNKHENKYIYRYKYRNKTKRKIIEYWYFLTYFLFFFIAFSPILFGSFMNMKLNFLSSVIFILFIISFAALAILQLFEYKKIYSAKYIIEEQGKIINN